MSVSANIRSPGPEIAVLLAVYDFVSANKFFTSSLLQSSGKKDPPFAAFLSMISYLLHHAYRSSRATLYGVLCLITLRIIIEDPTACKRLCDPNISVSIQLCRQRPPTLPPAPQARSFAAHILDICIDTINHNLRRRLDLTLYAASLRLIHRILCCLAQNHNHLPYHWSLLWQSLLSLTKFLQTYAQDIISQPVDIQQLTTPLFKSLTIAVAAGNAFLQDPSSYDDLFYKLVESAPVLEAIKKSFSIKPEGSATSVPIDVLIQTAKHFHAILEQEKGVGRLRNMVSSRDVHRVIRDGYESLEVPDLVGMGVEDFDLWREGEERGLVKRIGRGCVEDVRRLVG